MSLLYEKVYACLCGGIIGDAMGAPVEGMHYEQIQSKFGWIDQFQGAGTDDSAIKMILIDALLKNDGYVTADEWAGAFLNNRDRYPLFYVPVRNMFHKIEAGLVKPVDAGYGNMQSSSSAMSISPFGIVNANNPRQAALEAWEAAGLIHGGPSAFCRDGAAAIAAAVAAAFSPDATVDDVLEAATAYLHPQSSADMITRIQQVLALVDETESYEQFRQRFYEDYIECLICDSRETVPCVLAVFKLAQGDGQQALEYAANFGRDSDTIGTMVGAICGAFGGKNAFPPAWISELEQSFGKAVDVSKEGYDFEAKTMPDQRVLASQLEALIMKRAGDARAVLKNLDLLGV